MKLNWLFFALIIGALSACTNQPQDSNGPDLLVTSEQNKLLQKQLDSAFNEVAKLPSSKLSIARATQILATYDPAIRQILTAEQWSLYDSDARNAWGENLYRWARNPTNGGRLLPHGRSHNGGGGVRVNAPDY